MTWLEFSRDNFNAAKLLLSRGHLRSSVSRSYYAAFAALTAAMERGATFPRGREAPLHATLPLLIRNYLSQVRVLDRRRLNADVQELYDKRVTADYRMSRTMNRDVALRCVFLAQRILETLKETNA